MTRNKLIGLAVSLAIVLLAALVGLRWLEQSVTFDPVPFSQSTDWAKPAAAADVWFRASDGANLNGWFFSSSAEPPRTTIIYFHGNGGNINGVRWVGERLAASGFDVLVFDYRGYGKSSGGSPSEQGLYLDGDAAYDYVVKTRGVPVERLVLYGQSLGTGIVADVASRRRCGAVVIESGLSSTEDMTRLMLPPALRWVHVFARYRFDSARKLGSIHCPILVTHGDPDPVVPTDQGRALFAAANEPKQLLIVPGSGHNVLGSGGVAYLSAISGFIHASTNH